MPDSRWIVKATSASDRIGICMAIGNDKLYIAGGYDNNIWEWDGNNTLIEKIVDGWGGSGGRIFSMQYYQGSFFGCDFVESLVGRVYTEPTWSKVTTPKIYRGEGLIDPPNGNTKLICFEITLGSIVKIDVDASSYTVLSTNSVPGTGVHSAVFEGKLYTLMESGKVHQFDGVNLLIDVGTAPLPPESNNHLIVFNNKLYACGIYGEMYEYTAPSTWTKVADAVTEEFGSCVSYKSTIYFIDVSGSVFIWNQVNAFNLIYESEVEEDSPIYPIVFNGNLYAINSRDSDFDLILFDDPVLEPSNYYVDLNITSYGAGTEEDPWNFEQVRNYFDPEIGDPCNVYPVDGDTIHIKGAINTAWPETPIISINRVLPNVNITVKAWDIKENGLWLMDLTDVGVPMTFFKEYAGKYFGNIIFKDFGLLNKTAGDIIMFDLDTERTDQSNVRLKNSMIYADGNVTIENTEYTDIFLYGCTIYSNNDVYLVKHGDTRLNVYDGAIKANNIYEEIPT